MTFVVSEKCIKCKYTDCVEVCPVDCFYEGEYMLVINPNECIDCGICVIECPIEAIMSDTSKEGQRWVQHNATFSQKWQNITTKLAPPDDAKVWENIPNKFETYFK